MAAQSGSDRRLLQLLAINLASGIAVAALLLGGLMVLNPGNLRGLILADQAGYAALGMLAFGFAVTFGSTAMGSAIMAIGQGASSDRAQD